MSTQLLDNNKLIAKNMLFLYSWMLFMMVVADIFEFAAKLMRGLCNISVISSNKWRII